MAQTFPFTRAKGAPGWAFGEKLTSAQQNTVDLNAAQAADGLMFSDRSGVRNWRKEFTITNRGRATVWSSDYDVTGSGRWLTFGNTASLIVGSAFVQDADDEEVLTLPAIDITPFSAGAATDGAGVVVVGGNPNATSASKSIESSDDGKTWTTRSSVDATTAQINVIEWIGFKSLFVAGLSNGNIETSPDAQTWTNRTVPNANARNGFATDGATIIVAVSSVSTDKIITSADGVTWIERTVPTTTTVRKVVWISSLSKFLMLGNNDVLSSTDGITWSASGLTNPILNTATVATSGRVVVVANDGSDTPAAGIQTSIDGGVTWEISGNSNSFGGIAGMVITHGDNQFVISQGSGGDAGKHVLSFRGGV